MSRELRKAESLIWRANPPAFAPSRGRRLWDNGDRIISNRISMMFIAPDYMLLLRAAKQFVDFIRQQEKLRAKRNKGR